MFTNVMWATDGSAHADRALGYAVQIALRDGATLHAVHVVERFATGRVAGQNAHLNADEIVAKVQREVAGEPEQIASVLHMIPGNTGDAAALIAERAREVEVEVEVDLIVAGRGVTRRSPARSSAASPSARCISPPVPCRPCRLSRWPRLNPTGPSWSTALAERR